MPAGALGLTLKRTRLLPVFSRAADAESPDDKRQDARGVERDFESDVARQESRVRLEAIEGDRLDRFLIEGWLDTACSAAGRQRGST